MNQVTLIFPDIPSMADFILTQSISNAEVNSTEHKLAAPLTDDKITLAIELYGAVKYQKPVYLFNDELDD